MSKPFRRTGPKIGRNDPCPCGSGKKYKRCHGNSQRSKPGQAHVSGHEKQIIAEGRRLFERHKAKEIQRQKQQGLGKAIISRVFKGYRFVAVGSKLLYGKWNTFPDFLAHYIRVTIGADWGNAEIAKPLEQRHPIMQWYDKICRLQKAHSKGPGQVFETPLTGAVSAYNRLAYNLYLIAHNGTDIQTRLLRRLKNKDNFQGVYYEIQVAAWLIKAGFELEFEDEEDFSTKHCEFTATYVATGEKYSVEAKSRQFIQGGSSRMRVGTTLGKALEKNATHERLVFIDLNKPLHTSGEAYRAGDRAEAIIKQSQETMEIDGSPAPSAYVCITNMSDQHNLDGTSFGTMVVFTGFKIPDFMGEYPSLRDAARARERHLPLFRLMRSIEEHRDIPQTFDGELPSEVFRVDQNPPLKVGNFYLVPGPDGVEIPAVLMQATVGNGQAMAVLRDPRSGKNWIGTFDMSDEELADYARHPDTYFGTYHKQGRSVETIMDMYDFIAEAYENTPREKLIELLPNYPDLEELRRLDQKELVEILAERYTYGMIEKGAKFKTKEEIIAERKGLQRKPSKIEKTTKPLTIENEE